MYRGFDLQQVARQFPEIFRYTRVGPTVAAIPATTRELGDATAAEQYASDGLQIVSSVAPNPALSADVGQALLQRAKARHMLCSTSLTRNVASM